MHAEVLCRAIVIACVGIALTTAAQTNSSSDYERWFVLPKPRLQAEYTAPPMSSSGLQQGEASLGSPKSGADRSYKVFELYYRKQQDFDFTPRAHVSEDPLSRALASVFEPEVFRVGRTTTVSCSILTAIKRKNPLCLLNPIFLQVTW